MLLPAFFYSAIKNGHVWSREMSSCATPGELKAQLSDVVVARCLQLLLNCKH
ncbi:hypothetical protein ACFQZE_23730 [Paenibacillus sp. GCM10027627]|uniref:hypothetical protein n=1 Tax=unclassified Paenibacillus TaxID=185978 RepID=UPI003626EE13